MSNLTITSLLDIHIAKSVDPNLGKTGGSIDFNGRIYTINVASQTVRRESTGWLSRACNATWDFFTRGSLTSRAETMGNIIFGRERAVLPTGIKNGKQSAKISDLVKNIDTTSPGSGVKYRVKTFPDGVRTEELRSPKMPELITSEGSAKKLNRRVLIRGWLHNVDEDNSSMPKLSVKNAGHSSIELTNKTTKEKTYMGLNQVKQRAGFFSKFSVASVVRPHSDILFEASYRAEKISQVSDKTKTKLEKAKIQPGPLQHRLKQTKDNLGGEYGASASSKIYLPCHGLNQASDVTGAPRKIMFGLSESRVKHAMDGMKKEKNLNYKLISKDRNCSGFVMQMLLSGGANKFVQRPKAEFYYTPKEVQQYTRDVQQRLDWLNDYSDHLIDLASKGLLAENRLELIGVKKGFGAGIGIPKVVRNAVAKLTSEFDLMTMESRLDGALVLMNFLTEELGDHPEQSLAKLPAEKIASFNAMIRLLHLIREEIN